MRHTAIAEALGSGGVDAGNDADNGGEGAIDAHEVDTSESLRAAAAALESVARRARTVSSARILWHQRRARGGGDDDDGSSGDGDGGDIVTAAVKWTQRDPHAEALRKYVTHHTVIAGGRADVRGSRAEPVAVPSAAPEESSCALECSARNLTLRFYNGNERANGSGGGDDEGGSGSRSARDATRRVEIWSAEDARVAAPARLLRTIKTGHVHGEVYADTVFGGCAYSPAEHAFVYVAEAKRPAYGSHFERDGDDDGGSGGGGQGVERAAKPHRSKRGFAYRYHEDYGEQFADRRAPRLYALDMAAASPRDWRVAPLRGAAADEEAEGASGAAQRHAPSFDGDVGEPQCGSGDGGGGKLLAFVVRRRRASVPRGIVYCFNRPSELHLAALARRPADGRLMLRNRRALPLPDALERREWDVRCPRFCPDQKQILFVATPVMSVHNSAHLLCSVALDAAAAPASAASARVIVGAPAGADTRQRRARWEFYPASLGRALLEAEQLFADANHIVLNARGSRTEALLLDIRSGKRRRLLVERVPSEAGTEASPRRQSVQTVHDCRHSRILFSTSSLCEPPRVELGDMATALASSAPRSFSQTDADADADDCESGEEPPLLLRAHDTVLLASACASAPEHDAVVRQTMLSLATGGLPSPQTSAAECFAVVSAVPRRIDGLLPLVVLPHGGPHAAAPDTYAFGVDLLVRLGFAVLQVNYRGSTGQDDARLRSLLGRIGEQDVRECHLAVHAALESPQYARALLGDARARGFDRTRVAVLGGSHGGFLAAHLTAQYPELFCAAVLRNPVVNIASMAGASDIPDWCYVECGIDMPDAGNAHANADEHALLSMWRRSPIRHAKRVRAPTLLQIGAQDRRVPPSQGFEWARAVQTTAGAVRVLLYPQSNHAIDDSPRFEDAWVHGAAWLLHFCGVGAGTDAKA